MTKGDWWFKFEFSKWRNDPCLRRCLLETKGFWIDLLCVMREAGQPFVEGTYQDLARLLGCFPDEVERCVLDLDRTKTAEIERDGDLVKIRSRRYEKELASMMSNRTRQAKFRENGGGDPERWTAIRATILIRDSKMCAYCGKRATTVDHVIARSKGGTNDESNLVACCKACNLRKGNRTLAEAGMSFFPSFNTEYLKSNIEVTEKYADRVKSKSKSKSKEREEEAAAKAATPRKIQTFEEIVSSLASEPAYRGINVQHEAEKAVVWIKGHKGRKFTKTFFLNWLNKCEPALEPEKPKERELTEMDKRHIAAEEEYQRERVASALRPKVHKDVPVDIFGFPTLTEYLEASRS